MRFYSLSIAQYTFQHRRTPDVLHGYDNQQDKLREASEEGFGISARQLHIRIADYTSSLVALQPKTFTQSLVVTANSSLAASQSLPDPQAPQRQLNDENGRETEHDTVAGYEANTGHEVGITVGGR